MIRRFWSTRSELERVELYTRQSLYSIQWLLVVLIAFSMLNNHGWHASMTVAVVLGLVPNLLAFQALRALSGDDRAAPPARLLGALAAACVLVAGLALLLPEDPRTGAVLLVCVAIAFGYGGLRDNRVALLAIVGCAVASGAPTRDLGVLALGVGYGAFLLFTVRASLWILDVMHELDRARGAQAALAVAEERLRFSRDVHDVLGRQLSTIAVQAELAATLAARADPDAADRMLDVRATAHQALREARELARGYRAVSLEQEVDGARSLLRSAGITMTADVDRLPETWREAAAWVVREATTNVLRHSAAGGVEVRYADGVLSVTNDRPHAATAAGTGTGLSGLRERLAPLGATLTTDRVDGTFTVTATFPEEGPR
jgi:two-component system, NarL family, sensor histidine kinase DesK